jgi:hypothetical protein
LTDFGELVGDASLRRLVALFFIAFCPCEGGPLPGGFIDLITSKLNFKASKQPPFWAR